MVADGEQVAADAGWYDIIVEAVDPDGGEWRANVAYGVGETPVTDRGVKVGPKEPGQPKLEGATVSAEWVDSDTLKVCVDGGETSLAVGSFQVSIGVSTSDGIFFDSATGNGES